MLCMYVVQVYHDSADVRLQHILHRYADAIECAMKSLMLFSEALLSVTIVQIIHAYLFG